MLKRLTACAIVARDDQFLLVEERALGKIVLNNPSGTWEQGETLAQTASREAAEEAAVSFEPTYLVGTYVTLHTSLAGQRVCTVRFAYGGNLLSGLPPVKRDNSILGTYWLRYAELIQQQERLRSSAVLRSIDDYLAGHRYPMDLVNHMEDS